MSIKGLYKLLANALMVIALCVVVTSCGGNKNEGNEVPENFNSIGDSGRMAYMMKTVSADSVARFLCDAALGRLSWAKIDSVPQAALYAYEHYRDDEALGKFNDEFDAYMGALPLKDKMKMYLLSGKSSPESVGYDLGLEYVGNIREKELTVKDVDKEIAEFKKVADADTYDRFVKGFKTVLRLDHGRDLSEDIYKKFSNLE